MYWILIIGLLIFINFLLLRFSCNSCNTKTISQKPKLNMPEKNNLISQPVMADK